MFLEIDALLTGPEVERLRAFAAASVFVDGRVSNPHNQAKNNLQADTAGGAQAEPARLMAAALGRNAELRAWAFPRTMAPPLLAKYAPGMAYGVHGDAAFLPMGARAIRSDLSCTVFLSDPEAYDGGELAVHLGTRPILFKGNAGSAVIYPSNTLHEVRPVARGERLVGLTFMESTVPDPANREILWQLGEVVALEGERMDWGNRTTLEWVRESLTRRWTEIG